MKKLLFAIALPISFSLHSQTNIYHPFPDSNAYWNFSFSQNCFPSGIGAENYSLNITGDTLINSVVYHKLYTPYVESYSTGICGWGYVGYKGAIRQDTAARKVYYYPPADTSEYLLYDFNMQIGDTVHGYTEPGMWGGDVVQNIDSVLVGSSYRKRWIINPCYNIEFIEGVGSTFGLFQFSPHCSVDFAQFYLTCFHQNGQTQYPYTSANCQLIDGVSAPIQPFSGVTIFPNPGNGTFTVNFNETDVKELIITDLLGNVILQEETISQKEIHLLDLPSGTFLLVLVGGEGETTVKKIINCR